MNKPLKQNNGMLRIAGFLLILVLISGAVSLLMVRCANEAGGWYHDDARHGHAWLHSELGLTEAEAARIDAFEPEYRAQRAKLELELEERVGVLGDLLHETDHYSSEVSEAVEGIHEVHGQLQELAIRHYFDMLRALPPEKQVRLRQLASEALSQPF